MPVDCSYTERAAIMQYDGGLNRLEAERLAADRPWDKDPHWGMPKPQQMTFGDDPAAQFFNMGWKR